MVYYIGMTHEGYLRACTPKSSKFIEKVISLPQKLKKCLKETFFHTRLEEKIRKRHKQLREMHFVQQEKWGKKDF